MRTPDGENLVYLDGPLYPNGCQLSDFRQDGALFTCHALSVLMGIVITRPELVGELIWEEGNEVCGVFMTPVTGAGGKLLRVERKIVRTDRWVSTSADSLGKAPYVALWVKLMLWLYGGWSWNLLRVARDPRENLWPLGYNVMQAKTLTPERASISLKGLNEIMVVVTSMTARNLVPAHVYLVERVDHKGIVSIRNTWGYDGPSAWGDTNDGLVRMEWPLFMANVDAFRWTNGLYWTPAGTGGTAPRVAFPKPPPNISPG